jgi:hypothetical protein
MPRALRALTAAALLILLVACGGSDKKTAATSSSSTSSSSRSSSSPSSSSPSTTTTSPSTSSSSSSSSSVDADQGPAYFLLPSMNIGCIFGDGHVRCDISGKTFTPPPQPADCELDWGNGIEVGDGEASFVCAGDTALGGPDVLEYGLSAQRGSLRCDSAETGITCTNLETMHGFELNRDGFRLF